MSGPHATHRSPNRVLLDLDGHPVPKLGRDGQPVTRTVIASVSPPPERLVRYKTVPVYQHALDVRFEPVITGKHSRGHTRPLEGSNRAKVESRRARLVQLRKSITIDQQHLQAAMS